VVAASTGHHGAAVAYAGRELGVPVRVVVSSTADPEKIEKIRSLGAGVLIHGEDSAVAEIHARGLAASEGLPFISPYNDPMVVAGQGTCGVELARQLDRADAVYIALGGGGLLSGMAAWLAAAWPGAAIIGCSPEKSAVMIRSLEAGELLELPSEQTLSDGTAGGVEPGAITFPWCRRLATELVTVAEEEIGAAMRAVHAAHGVAIEGAAGVAVAAYLRDPARWRGGRVVVVICGGNVSPSVLERVL
jgi:threonine dehydratase